MANVTLAVTSMANDYQPSAGHQWLCVAIALCVMAVISGNGQ